MTRVDGAWRTDPRTQAVCGALTGAGFRALFVGGCVRNALLGRPVADVDIATDAEPDAVMALAAAAGLHPVPTGIEHGTVTVVSDGRPFEVTSFRRDVETFGRHATVAFSTDLAEDAARRDFTMNALYAEPDGSLVDPLGGLPDLRARRVRFVGDPGETDRRGLPAHPALLPHPRLVRRPGGRPRRRTASPPARRCRRGSTGSRASGSAPRSPSSSPRPTPPPRSRRWRRPASSPACCPAPTRRRWRRSSTSKRTPGPRRAGSGASPRSAGARTGPSACACRAPTPGRSRRRPAAIGAAEPDAVAAWRNGADVARDAALVRAAALGAPPPPGLEAEIARGAAAVFPVRAADLPLSGPALGAALRRLEARWAASGLRLDAAALLREADG